MFEHLKRKMIKVSVITPVYNTPVSFLEKYFSMLEKQSLDDFEIIIIDDGSTEKSTVQYLNKKYRENKEKIILLKMENNKGISCCRNIGLSRARGEYIAILDSDDWCSANFIQKMYMQAKRENADMIVCGYNICNDTEKIMEKIEASSSLFFQFASSISPRLFRREIVDKMGIRYPEGCLVEDLSFNAFLVYHCKNICVCDNYLYNIRIHENSTSHDLYRYTRLNIRNAPLDYIEENLKIISPECDDERYKAMCGQVIMVIYCISCVWSRNSSIKEIFELSRRGGEIVRKIPNYMAYAKYYHIENFGKGITTLGTRVYAFFAYLRCEKVAAVIIAQLAKSYCFLMRLWNKCKHSIRSTSK